VTPAAAIDAWLAELATQRRLAAHTLAGYRRDLDKLRHDLMAAGDLPLADVLGHHVRRFVAQHHGRGLSGRSLGRLLSAWRGFFTWLGERGLIRANPCDGMRPPKSPKRLPKAVSVDAAAQLLDAPVDPDDIEALRDAAMFELFYSSGLRLAELVALDAAESTTSGMVDALDAAGVLTERALQAVLPSGRQMELTGFLSVDEQKLHALDDKTITDLHRQGALAMAYLHLLSLRQFRPLMELAAARESAAAAPSSGTS